MQTSKPSDNVVFNTEKGSAQFVLFNGLKAVKGMKGEVCLYKDGTYLGAVWLADYTQHVTVTLEDGSTVRTEDWEES